MFKSPVHCASLHLVLTGLLLLPAAAPAQTADDLTKLIHRLADLDSIDLCQFEVKYRAGLEPSLAAVDADESGMTVLKNPYEPHGQGKPGAAGWYRVSFVVPAKLGVYPLDDTPCGIESNLQGFWEIYTYSNGKPAGLGSRQGDVIGFLTRSNLPASEWVKNAPMDAPKQGDKVTIAILAASYPLGRGSPEGFALRHLRMRIAGGHSPNREPFFRELLVIREKLRMLSGDELETLRGKVKGPLSKLEAVFAAAKFEPQPGGRRLYAPLSQAMRQAAEELAAAQKK
jgi:hypothetical protein